MTETGLVVPEAQKVECPSVHLYARNPNEMALAKGSLETWLKAKVGQCSSETEELAKALEVAMRNGWATATLRKHTNLASKRADFYRKCLSAVEDGYTLIPNFPIDLFAVRVRRTTPLHSQYRSDSPYQSSGNNPAKNPEAEVLPLGEGRYVSGESIIGITGNYTTKDSSGKEIKKYFFDPTDFSEVAFPMEAAVAEVMDATAEALAKKIFDEVGICPQSRRGDPLIIGRILGPKVGYMQKEVSFLIAWHLDLRTL